MRECDLRRSCIIREIVNTKAKRIGLACFIYFEHITFCLTDLVPFQLGFHRHPGLEMMRVFQRGSGKRINLRRLFVGDYIFIINVNILRFENFSIRVANGYPVDFFGIAQPEMQLVRIL